MAPELKWKDDPRRETLKQDVESGKIPLDMKPAAARETREEYLMMDPKTFRSRLRGMRKSVSGAPQKTKKTKKERWKKKNQTRLMLHNDIAVGLLPATTDVRLAWVYREEYSQIEWNLWKGRWKSMCSIVTEKLTRAKSDADDYEHDRNIHPPPTHNARGEPEWNYHEAADLLEIDVDDGKHKDRTPQQLYYSRRQYRDFSLETFRGHLHQELQTRKWRSQWVDGKKEYPLVDDPTD